MTALCAECGAILTPEAQYCSRCGAPVFSPGQARTPHQQDRLGKAAPAGRGQGERKLVTILFSDVVGSTRIAGTLDPEEWKEVVDGAHRRVGRAVVQFGGTIAQLMGDGVLAFFGAPITHEDDAIRAVRAALDLQGAMRGYREELAGLVDDFALRVGIHTGRVVVGDVGGEARREYLAMGDPVNVASRLEGAAEPGGVLVSQVTADLVEGCFDLESVGFLSLKGVEAPVEGFQVVGVKQLPGNQRGLPGLKAPLVGRREELDRLGEALTDLRAGRGQAVVVTGEAGIGKTRLVEEARARVGNAETLEIRWLEGRALSYGENLSFWAINQLLLSDLGLSDGESPIRIGVAFKRRIRRLFGDEPPNVTPYLLNLMGVPLEGEAAEQLRQLDGETRKYQTIVALTAYLEKAAEKGPTALLLEDAHWMDPSSLEAIESVLKLTDQAPLMVLLVMRAEREHRSWDLKQTMESDYPHRFTGIHLQGMTKAESSDLATHLLASRETDKRLKQVLLERACGNPFYLEELVRDLMERGLWVHGLDGLGLASSGVDWTIPKTLQGVLSGRIDRLPEGDRHVLQMASVIGQTFLLPILEGVWDGESSALASSLARLQRGEFLREETCLPEREYAFRHSLTQEAAYQSLLVEQRKVLHRRVGESLETLFPDRREEFLGLLAHHFEKSGAEEEAVRYLLEAGDRARLGEELPEAIGYYRRALPFLEELEDWERASKTWLKLGLVHQAGFDFETARQSNDAASAVQERIDSPVLAKPVHASCERTLRMDHPEMPASLDPGMWIWWNEWPVYCLYAGLTQLDSDDNIVPHVARSWEVLDHGLRYVFHLAADARWTDGRSVTAHDFEWAWKRNLAPGTGGHLVDLLDPIRGARAFREGLSADPESVGVHAIDDTTLEVLLETPAPYFIYVTAQPVAYPLPTWSILEHGDQWWTPENIVSNGPFRLEWFASEGLDLVRNDAYFASFKGNVGRVEYRQVKNSRERLQRYQDNRCDVSNLVEKAFDRESIPEQQVHAHHRLSTQSLFLCPTSRPLQSLMVRQALAMAIDRGRVLAAGGGDERTAADGGLIPPGMSGHSPGLALPFDPDGARNLLARAGYPSGVGIPPLTAPSGPDPSTQGLWGELARQWRETLGIDLREEVPTRTGVGSRIVGFDITWAGQSPDTPDPYAFLWQSTNMFTRKDWGWYAPIRECLASDAAYSVDRKVRMAFYRQIDRRFVVDEVRIIPIGYGGGPDLTLIKPWVKGYRESALGCLDLSEVRIEDSQSREFELEGPRVQRKDSGAGLAGRSNND